MLAAVDVAHRIEPDSHQWRLMVPDSAVAEALDQLERYQYENQYQPARATSVVAVDSGWTGVLGYLLIIWLLPSLEAQQVLGWGWRSIGGVEAGRVLAGEWWRCVTALTLHADLAHIVANSLFGSVFGLFVGRYLGSGFGWLLILISGALGNAMNAGIQPETFRSIGASTANFGALGVGAAFVWRRGYFRGRGWRRSLAPLFAAIAMLAYTGTGGENTDVVAHFTGCLAGIVFGVLAARVDVKRLGRAGQLVSAASAVGLVILAWTLAGFAP